MEDLLALQEKAVVTLLYASDGDAGRMKTDPIVMDEITEGRHILKTYSCCADLAHWMYQEMGFDHKYINRVKLGHYTIGYNIARLGQLAALFGEKPKSKMLPPETRFFPGDVIVIWANINTSDAHAVCVLSDDMDADGKRVLNTVEGGQAAPLVVRKYAHVLTAIKDRQMIGKRTMRYVVRFEKMCQLLKA